MKRLRTLTAAMAAVLALSGAVCADDGLIVNKSMSNTVKVPAEFEDANNPISKLPLEAEHAYTDMLLFYVPMQAASGATGDDLPEDTCVESASGNQLDPRVYCNIDGGEEEIVDVAKPLVNTFIYGPLLEVEDTAFGHSWMDAYAAVSLDDGMTWKQTNLSLSATETSFNIETDHVARENDLSDLPVNHTKLLTKDDIEGWHALGYREPYTNYCTECHGATLTGEHEAPSCFSCHGSIWKEDNPDAGTVPQIADATWLDADGGILKGSGEEAPADTTVTIVNPMNEKVLGSVISKKDGTFIIDLKKLISDGIIEKAPCQVAAVANDIMGEPLVPRGTPEDCEGYPPGEIDLADYPGGVYNIFQASAANKTLVVWTSRFCEQGQPAYSFAYDANNDDLNEDNAEDLIAKRTAVATLLGIDLTKDLYLSDLFGVSGQQGSIDFADEEYPQAGIVPFGCVWTARGVLLPGDDPRTELVEEASHMVWTKAERLTSGRRDPYRIEVQGVPGAGFAVTWQEDPEGLRPGQGEGPGEGWSAANAHDKTDVWYSFIPWEYFDLVEFYIAENEPDPTLSVNIVEHDLTLSGRPQVFVPMAMPMRITNNDRCTAEDYAPGVTLYPTDGKYFSYCNYDVAQNYGLQDFCAATVDIPLGPQGELQPICVNEDGLPNVANTQATRPRLALQGYDSDFDGAVDSAWVIIQAEEGKGLGRYLFWPNGTPCDAEDPFLGCVSDEGKNQWYFSFDMGDPATSATMDDPDGLVKNLVSQGHLLVQPEVDFRTGMFYPPINTELMWNFVGYNFDIYNTEIARRASLLTQGVKKVNDSSSKLAAFTLFKQGTMQRGGPADILARRIIAPTVNLPQCTTATVCTQCVDVLDCTDNALNPKYDPNAVGSAACLNTNPPSKCFQYIDGDGNLTNEPQTCVVTGQDCDDTLESCDGLDNCTCEDKTICESGDVEGVDPTDNPYAFRNMECLQPDGVTSGWILQGAPGEDDYNPYYPGGICTAPAINLSSNVPDVCKDDETDTIIDGGCPQVDFSVGIFGTSQVHPILQGLVQGEGDKTRVLTWHQCPSGGVPQDDSELEFDLVDCDSDYRTDEFVNLADQTWYNPWEMAKGHRGFLDGDFVMLLYGWTPNWRLNTEGNDRNDLYVRRSFDGAVTWTATPAEFTASDAVTYKLGQGTVTCESFRGQSTGDSETATEPHLCFGFAAGAAEHQRNVTQHKRFRITTLDPRFAPSGGPRGQSITDGCVNVDDPTIDATVMTCDDLSVYHDTDLRNPSRYAMVFETGDNNTVVDATEAEPLDLFYSRAERFGDHYVVWAETDSTTALPVDETTDCYPSDPHEDDDIIGSVVEGSGFCNEFDRMNTRSDTHSSEADLEMNPAGTKFYGVWAQWVFEGDRDNYEGEIVESDAMSRRLWWIDDYICAGTLDPNCAWSLPGTSQEEEPTP